MSAASPPVDRSRLDARIEADYDYTHGDAVIDTLNEIITCPLVLDVTCPMLIFNNQCYETNAFDQFLLSENARKELYLQSGYRRDRIKFRDPRTSEEFNFDFAISQMIHRTISLFDLKEILVSRISGLTLEESIVYVSGHNDVLGTITVDEFISHVTNSRAPRAAARQLYHDQISGIARNGLQGQPARTTILQ